MSIIAAAVVGNATHIGCDGISIQGNGDLTGVVTAHRDRKWLAVGCWRVGLVGYTTAALRLSRPGAWGELPGRLRPEAESAWLIADHIQGSLKEWDWKMEPADGDGSSGPLDYGQSALLAAPGVLYGLNSDMTVNAIERGYDARGSGMDIALGAMHAQRGSPETMVPAAIEACLDLAHGCGGEGWLAWLIADASGPGGINEKPLDLAGITVGDEIRLPPPDGGPPVPPATYGPVTLTEPASGGPAGGG